MWTGERRGCYGGFNKHNRLLISPRALICIHFHKNNRLFTQ